MKCLKCHKGELQVGVTSLTYSREGSVIQVKVDGVPAEICPVCGEAYLGETVAQQIFDIVDPLLQAGQRMGEETILPAPTVDIHFPPLAPAHLQRAVAA
jgi:YgiT-type zinc finger domain-containing protein